MPPHVCPRQEDWSLGVPLPRRERTRGRSPGAARHQALGRRDEVEASGLLDGLIASAARHSRRSIVLSRFYRGELPELHRLSIGPDLVFGRLWTETGDVLKSLLADRHFAFDVERAVYLTVLHRLMISGSDRHASDWLNRVRVPGAEGLNLDHAYKAMAWLGAVDADDRNTAEAVEEALYRHRQPLFGAVSIAFFDTTTLWFEGAGGDSLGQYGHSKDYRGHLPGACNRRRLIRVPSGRPPGRQN